MTLLITASTMSQEWRHGPTYRGPSLGWTNFSSSANNSLSRGPLRVIIRTLQKSSPKGVDSVNKEIIERLRLFLNLKPLRNRKYRPFGFPKTLISNTWATTTDLFLSLLISMAFRGKFREVLMKYGKVGLGVHFSVSAASITGLYVAIKNNVDVESLLEKVGMGAVSKQEDTDNNYSSSSELSDDFVGQGRSDIFTSNDQQKPKKNKTAELMSSTGGALALAVICNKALFPIRVPITIALTPAVSRYLARRRFIKNSLWLYILLTFSFPLHWFMVRYQLDEMRDKRVVNERCFEFFLNLLIAINHVVLFFYFVLWCEGL